MNTFLSRRARRTGAALAVALTLGIGAVACDDSDKSADTRPTAATSAPVTPSQEPTTAPASAPPSSAPASASGGGSPTPAPTPKEEAPSGGGTAGSAGGEGSRSTTGGSGGTTSTGGSSASGDHAGASAVCIDGSSSYSAHRRGTCSHHGGVARWLKDLPS
ncbi:DUF3761 domain-containing protein [Streptomyces sp. NPDC020379]|uniref:DUF3761 domain-containing protein n=1 Tax=Streptomyces sp. NPDC020379 TaxID=3365071 RepID=UPI003795188C